MPVSGWKLVSSITLLKPKSVILISPLAEPLPNNILPRIFQNQHYIIFNISKPTQFLLFCFVSLWLSRQRHLIRHWLSLWMITNPHLPGTQHASGIAHKPIIFTQYPFMFFVAHSFLDKVYPILIVEYPILDIAYPILDIAYPILDVAYPLLNLLFICALSTLS